MSLLVKPHSGNNKKGKGGEEKETMMTDKVASATEVV
jgi:hypothetical protein